MCACEWRFVLTNLLVSQLGPPKLKFLASPLVAWLLGCFTKKPESERNGEEEREKVRQEERKMNK